jgi:hypothetical protein
VSGPRRSAHRPNIRAGVVEVSSTQAIFEDALSVLGG